MSKPVFTTPQADAQILALDEWWREHRDEAPDLFEQELAATFRMIAAAPRGGNLYPHPRAVVRRVLMRTSRNHLYYVELDLHVLVVAVWGAIKHSGPDLAMLE